MSVQLYDFNKIFDNIRDIRMAIEDDGASSSAVTDFDICDQCNVKMNIEGLNLKCAQCGYIKPMDSFDCDSSMGSGNVSTYCNSDYSKVQYNQIYNQLLDNSKIWKGNAFPNSVFKITTKIYNDIQKNQIEKFVKRGSYKNEIIASIINIVCQKLTLDHKRKDIAEFMNLRKGFSRGDTIVRELINKGIVNIDSQIPDNSAKSPIVGFTERYLDALNILTDKNKDVIVAVVQLSEDKKIGMNSQISSKVTGAIWVLLQKIGVKITLAKLEKATDNTKKNTFIKFVDILTAHEQTFAPIWQSLN